ncbi:MAG TPA: hypothetical protein VJO13_02525 [Ktedonobacterales bacterium]|nr:hypothetical protein [Ktedonobacterales bacterium]
MHCPSCGYPIDQQSLDYCPQCGRPLTAPADQRPAASAPFADTGSPLPSDPPVSPVSPTMQTPPQSPHTPYTPYVQPGQPGAYPSAPGSYDQPYGQSAPSSYPSQGGPYQPDYPPMAYAQPQTPYVYPSSPQRKNRTGLIVGIVAAAVVLLVACTGGTIFAVHSLGRTSATTRPAASPTLSGSKVYSNTFSSSADDWAQDPQHCFLADDGYHAAHGYFCTVPVADQDNVDISVNVRQVSGPTNWSYGLFFRQQDIDNHYAFMITSNGDWVFVRCVNADCTTPVYFTANRAIKPGLDTTNTIEVRAKGPHFVFFVNGTQVGSYDDTTITFGTVGFIATGADVDCAFTDLVITRPD